MISPKLGLLYIHICVRPHWCSATKTPSKADHQLVFGCTTFTAFWRSQAGATVTTTASMGKFWVWSVWKWKELRRWILATISHSFLWLTISLSLVWLLSRPPHGNGQPVQIDPGKKTVNCLGKYNVNLLLVWFKPLQVKYAKFPKCNNETPVYK